MKAAQGSNLIRALVFKGHKAWVAQCLEHDIATQAEKPADILRQLELALEAEVRFCAKYGGVPFERLPKAPQKYWDMWEKGIQGPDALLQDGVEDSDWFLSGIFTLQRPLATAA